MLWPIRDGLRGVPAPHAGLRPPPRSLCQRRRAVTGEELPDIIAFVHDAEEQKKFSEADIPHEMEDMMEGAHTATAMKKASGDHDYRSDRQAACTGRQHVKEDFIAETASSDRNEQPGRRDSLYIATGAVGAVGAALALWPFIDSLNPAADVRSVSAAAIDLTPIELGQRVHVAQPAGLHRLAHRGGSASAMPAQRIDRVSPRHDAFAEPRIERGIGGCGHAALSSYAFRAISARVPSTQVCKAAIASDIWPPLPSKRWSFLYRKGR